MTIRHVRRNGTLAALVDVDRVLRVRDVLRLRSVVAERPATNSQRDASTCVLVQFDAVSRVGEDTEARDGGGDRALASLVHADAVEVLLRVAEPVVGDRAATDVQHHTCRAARSSVIALCRIARIERGRAVIDVDAVEAIG